MYLEGDKSIKEHIKIMEEHIGRKLKKNEVVHHKNLIKINKVDLYLNQDGKTLKENFVAHIF